MSKKGLGKFVAGAAIGAGLGLLFAPKKGEELRGDLKKKLDDIVKQAKDIDIVDLDKEKALEIAKEKGAQLKVKAQELVDLAVEKGTPVLKKTANDVLDNVIKVSKETQKKLTKSEEKK